jgi:tetratricopeptide (TPR) repeat protein
VLTLVIGIAVAALCSAVAGPTLGIGWAIFLGFVGFLVPAVVINLLVKKRMETIFNAVQTEVEEMQDQMRRKVNMMQTKMVSGGKGLQKRLEKEQAKSIRDAIKILDRVAPLRKWNLLAQRQENTLRAQMHYQIKEFEKADEYFKKCFVMDPLTLAMKLTRQYKTDGVEAVEKGFEKGVKRFKDEQATILYALYSWILLKEERADDALVLLDEGKDKTEDETIRTNWEHIANGRLRRFSNAGLGDQWYALHLETPKPVKVKQRFGSKRLR